MISIEDSAAQELELDDINIKIFCSSAVDDTFPYESVTKAAPIRLLASSANPTGTPQRLTSIVEDVEAEKKPALVAETDDMDEISVNSEENEQREIIPVPTIDVKLASRNGSREFDATNNQRDSFMDLPFFQVPKKLAPNRESVTVGSAMDTHFLVERHNGQKAPPYSYWTKKNRDEDDDDVDNYNGAPVKSPQSYGLERQFSLHTVPSSISLKWIEITGKTPNPDVALKYEPPTATAVHNSQSNVSITSHNFRPMDKKDVLYGSSIFDLNHFESKLHGLADLGDGNHRDIEERGGGSEEGPGKKMILLKSPSFLAFCFANALFMFGFFNPLVFIIR